MIYYIKILKDLLVAQNITFCNVLCHYRPIILKAAKELRKLTEYSEVYINPDLTEAERILDRKRREDRFNLNQQERNNSSNAKLKCNIKISNDSLENAQKCTYDKLNSRLLNESITREKNISIKCKNGLKCFYKNATSLGNKFDELELIAKIEELDLIFITETWFSELNCKFLNGYESFNYFRKDRSGGGVSIYINKKFSSYELFDEVLCDSKVEQVWCGLQTVNEQIIVGCVYRPPGINEADNSILTSIKRSNEIMIKFNGFIICGDFNCPKIGWHSGSFSSCRIEEDSFDNGLLNTLDDCFYVQHVFEPTFQLSNESPKSILDLIITDNSERIYYIDHSPPLGTKNKGHLTLKWNYELKFPTKNVSNIFSSSCYNFRKGDYAAFSGFFNGLNWKQIFTGLDVNQMYEKFIDYYDMGCKRFIPAKALNKKDKSWMSKETKDCIKKKLKAWKLYLASGRSKELKEEYVKIRNKFHRSINKTVKKYELNIAKLSKRNPKLVYKYLNRNSIIKPAIKSLKCEKSGEIITDLFQVASILNDHFKSVFNKEISEPLPSFDLKSDVECDPDVEGLITKEKILEKLKELDPNKAIGPDKIHGEVLKNCMEAFSSPILYIFKESYRTGELPKLWKLANVTPLYKGGTKSSQKNYRPVSLTCILCKIFERIIKDIMLKHLIDNDLISKSQHGFLPNKSCSTNLLETIDFITEAISLGFSVDIVYTDFAKAFDKVSHQKLLHKLKSFGFGDSPLNWIKSFLSGRKQR
ncbi:unnamed protein product, partial [Brachionus calyciflorus]